MRRPTRHRTASNRRSWVLGAGLLLLLAGMPVAGQESTEPRLRGWINVVSGSEADATIDGVVTTIASTLRLSLSVSGAVEVVESRREADLVFEVAVQRQGGTYQFDAARVDLLQGGSEVIASRTAESLFDVFDVADQLTLDIVATVTDADVAFGAIVLENLGFPGDFSVQIDGVAAGTNISRIDRVLTGTRTVTVVRGTDEPAVLAEQRVQIREDAPAVVRFSIPYLSAAARQAAVGRLAAARAPLVGESVPADSTIAPELLPDDAQERLSLSRASLDTARPVRNGFTPAVLDLLRGVPGLPRLSTYRSRSGIVQLNAGAILVEQTAPVQPDELNGWRYTVTGQARPVRIDRAGDNSASPLGRSGMDLGDFYLFSSDAGLHFIMALNDDGPSVGLGSSYNVSLVADVPERTELWFRVGDGVDSGARTVVMRKENGEDRELASFRSPVVLENGAVIGTIPIEALARARESAGISGWFVELTIDEREGSDTRVRDHLDWGGQKLYF